MTDDRKNLERIEELTMYYEYNWGKKIELDSFPPGLTQEKYIVVLERIVETGESVLVGYNKCFIEKKVKE